MDQTRFDRLTRALASDVSRRSVVAACLGLLGGAGLARAAGAANSGNACARHCVDTAKNGRERSRCLAKFAKARNLCADVCRGADACDLIGNPNGKCGNSANCFCAETVEGLGLCLDLDLARCGRSCGGSDDCGNDAVCVEVSCCGNVPGRNPQKVCVDLAAACRGISEVDNSGGVRVRWP